MLRNQPMKKATVGIRPIQHGRNTEAMIQFISVYHGLK
jgi:hypothetical protein